MANKDEARLSTYVWHGVDCFVISTVMRDSSAAECPGRYAETIAFEFDQDKRERGKILDITGGGRALEQHMQVVEDFYKHGKRIASDE